MSWETEVGIKVAELENTPVIRCDIQQLLTDEQKETAHKNIAKNATVTLISDDNYTITVF
jgi:hypothetical protein